MKTTRKLDQIICIFSPNLSANTKTQIILDFQNKISKFGHLYMSYDLFLSSKLSYFYIL